MDGMVFCIAGIVVLAILFINAIYMVYKGNTFDKFIGICIIIVGIIGILLILIITPPPDGPYIDIIVVDSQGGSGYTDMDTTFEGTVYDFKGNPLGGVDIVAEGPNDAVGTAVTDKETGRFILSLNKEPTMPQNQNTGTITFTATYKGTSVQTTVTIINN
jgi:hypothetical protein